jgi:hypothetical protein
MQFHNPKNLAISISIEAAELLEHFRWKNYAAPRSALRLRIFVNPARDLNLQKRTTGW